MTPDLDTIRLLKEIERLQKLIASKTMATFEWALEQKTLRAERDAALAENERLRNIVSHLSVELGRIQMRPLLDALGDE